MARSPAPQRVPQLQPSACRFPPSSPLPRRRAIHVIHACHVVLATPNARLRATQIVA